MCSISRSSGPKISFVYYSLYFAIFSLVLELRRYVISNSCLFILARALEREHISEQDRDIRSVLKHSVQENSEVKEGGVASLTGGVRAQPTVSY